MTNALIYAIYKAFAPHMELVAAEWTRWHSLLAPPLNCTTAKPVNTQTHTQDA